VGWQSDPSKRPPLAGTNFGPDGSISVKCPLFTSFQSDAYALRVIAEYQQGKIIMWAWSSRGYVSRERQAAWHFNGDLDAMNEALRAGRHAMRDMFRVGDASEDPKDYQRIWEVADQAGKLQNMVKQQIQQANTQTNEEANTQTCKQNPTLMQSHTKPIVTTTPIPEYGDLHN
jgi:hypothetical protein